jgi:hypothetical protein
VEASEEQRRKTLTLASSMSGSSIDELASLLLYLGKEEENGDYLRGENTTERSFEFQFN